MLKDFVNDLCRQITIKFLLCICITDMFERILHVVAPLQKNSFELIKYMVRIELFMALVFFQTTMQSDASWTLLTFTTDRLIKEVMVLYDITDVSCTWIYIPVHLVVCATLSIMLKLPEVIMAMCY